MSIILQDKVEKEADQSADIIIKQIRNQKMEIVKERLKRLKKLNLLKDLDKKTFKPILTKQYPDREEIWIDNGTIKGHLLVTFMNRTEAEMQDKDFKCKLLYF